MTEVLRLFKAPLSLEGYGVMDEAEFAALMFEEKVKRYATRPLSLTPLCFQTGWA